MCNNTIELLKTIIDLCRCDKEKIIAITDVLKTARPMATAPEEPDDARTACAAEACFDPGAAAVPGSASGGMHGSSAPENAGAASPSQTAELESRIASLETEKSKLEQENYRLKTENGDLLQQVRGLREAAGKSNQEMTALSAAKNELTSALSSASENLKNAETRIHELETELENQKSRFETEIRNVRDDAAEQRRQMKSAEESLRKEIESLELRVSADDEKCRDYLKKLTAQQKETERVSRERDDIRAEYDRCSGIISGIPDIENISSLAKFIRSLPESVRKYDVLESLDLGNITNLLVQCGYTSRLSQIWENIRKKTMDSGYCHPDLTKLMIKLMDCYNRANPSLQLQTVVPETGIDYSAENHSRPEGKTVSRIRKVLFPGLKNSGGKVLSKPVVE